MWQCDLKTIRGGFHLQIVEAKRPLLFEEVLSLLSDNRAFREFWIHMFRKLPINAYKWETPALIAGSGIVFECAAIFTPKLERPADCSAFIDYFNTVEPVISFTNLGGDAELVVPKPNSSATNYCHFASFNRTADLKQQHRLWQCVAKTVLKRMGPTPLWLNTAGEGVPWLHIRIDQKPKYYAYKPFTEIVLG